MKVANVRLGQEVRDLTGKCGKDKLFSLELSSRALEMKASLSTPLQRFVKNILRQKLV
jgi:hypothetical protein